MRHVLGSFLALHWTVVFAVLSVVCMADVGYGLRDVLSLVGLGAIANTAAGPGNLLLSGAFATAFALASLLFLWAFVISLFSDPAAMRETDEVLRVAFAVGGAVNSAVLVAAMLLSVEGVFPAVALQLGAMLASYLAINVERMSVATGRRGIGGSATLARLMAAGAVRNHSLARLSRRPHQVSGGGR